MTDDSSSVPVMLSSEDDGAPLEHLGGGSNLPSPSDEARAFEVPDSPNSPSSVGAFRLRPARTVSKRKLVEDCDGESTFGKDPPLTAECDGEGIPTRRTRAWSEKESNALRSRLESGAFMWGTWKHVRAALVADTGAVFTSVEIQQHAYALGLDVLVKEMSSHAVWSSCAAPSTGVKSYGAGDSSRRAKLARTDAGRGFENGKGDELQPGRTQRVID
jgi:hypothetical protein